MIGFSIPQHFLREMITLTDPRKFSLLKVFIWLMYCIGTVRIFEGCLERYKAKINEGSLSLAKNIKLCFPLLPSVAILRTLFFSQW